MDSTGYGRMAVQTSGYITRERSYEGGSKTDSTSRRRAWFTPLRMRKTEKTLLRISIHDKI